MPYIDAVDMFVDRGHLGPVVRVELANYTSMMRGLSAEHSPAQVIKKVVESTNYLSYLQAEEGSDTPETSRAGNIGELVASATRFNTVTNFIDYVDTQIKLRKKNQRKNVDGRVQVMTVHKSKGLEFQVVFIIGTNEGVMPHAKGDMEEERRLFYVAMTRAKDDLYVSSITESVDPRGAIISRFVHEAGIIQDLTPEHEGGIVETSSEGNDESTSVVQV
jgi:DNA helicase-2/ATP-dependent DNA helicase PcrA